MANRESERKAKVRPETEEAEDIDALAAHQADRGPTEEEERLADRSAEEESSGMKESVSEHHAEMDKRGVEQRGEGRIE